MAKSWVGHNNKVFQKAIAEHRKSLEQQLHSFLRKLAEEVKLLIEAYAEDYYLPYYSGNLVDGTGVGVYFNGALSAYVPPKSAIFPQTMGTIKNIWGAEYLQDALNDATNEYSKGIWVVLFSTVPYAFRVNEEGTTTYDGMESFPDGFFSEGLVEEMLARFEVGFAREFPNIARQLTTI